MEQNHFRRKTVEELSDFFHNLFFLNVSVTRGGVFDIHTIPSFVVSVYRNSNDAIIGALLLDVPAAACLSGALCDLPEDMISNIVNSQSFNDDIWGDLQEVLNICSQLFTIQDGESITLEEVYQHPNNLPQEAFDVLANNFDPLLFRINIDGYGGGIMGVLDAENNPIFADTENEQQANVEESTNLQNDFFQDSPSTPANTTLYWEESEEEEDVNTVKSPTQSPNPIAKVGFGVVIGIIIGGLVVKSLSPSGSEVRIVEVQQPQPTVETVAPSAPTQVPAPKIVTKKQKFRNANEIEQVLITQNAFHMGCTTEFSGECLADEFPSHSVQLSKDYYIMRHELTQELYIQVMATNPSQFTSCGTTCPVENISWIQAVTFANRLSKFQALEECYTIDELDVTWNKGIECLGWRLPTEAEWEFAARGTKGQSEGRFAKKKNNPPEQRSDRNVWVYSGGNSPSAVAWYGGFDSHNTDNLGRKVGTGQGSTHSVCSKSPNDLDLCDMSGNVWEWIWDGYGAYPKTKRLVKDPMGTSTNTLKILRGGSWLSTESELRTSYRMYASRTVIDTMVPNYGSFGIRLVRTSPAVKPQKSN